MNRRIRYCTRWKSSTVNSSISANMYTFPVFHMYDQISHSMLVGCCLATKSSNLNNTKWNGWRQWHPKNYNLEIIGASLSKPHTCIANCEYGCLSICWITNGHIPNLNWTNRNEGTRALQICTCAKAFQCSVRWMWQRTPHHVTQCRWIYWIWETDCVWSERKGYCKTAVSAPKITGVNEIRVDRRKAG